MNSLAINFVVVWVRSLGGVLLLPIGEGITGFVIKLMVSCAFASTFVFQPHMGELGPLTLMSQFLYGAILTLPLVAGILFVNWVGEVIDVGRGMTISSILDPSSEVPHSFSSFVMQYAFLSYVASAGYLTRLIFFLIIPDVKPLSLDSIADSARDICKSLAPLLTMSSPILIGLLVTFIVVEISLSLLGKIVPGIQLSHESGV